MRCPTCKYPLIVVEIEEIEIDHCLACGGVWLDGGELELLLAGAGNRDELMGSLEAAAAGNEKAVRCPICSKTLQKVACGVEKKIRLDKCPSNDGLWFDRGELLEVIDMGDFPIDSRIFRLLHEVFGKKTAG